MSGVKLEGIFKSYGTVEVVHGIDLEVQEKEFVVLVGPSGCGKSTTLRMVAGLEDISKGEAYIDGRLINNVAPKDRDVAMVFQNYALYPHLTVAKNIAFGLNIRRVPKPEIERQVKEVAEILELTDYLDRRPSELSGGQRQRVAMGRAIVRHPKVFLFDEPLSNLDAKLRSQMRAEIKKLHKRLGVTSLYVTHDQVEAMTLADRIVVMQDGIIEQIGTPMELFRNPANLFVASFIGSPPMNQIDAVLRNTSKGPIAEIGNNIKLPLRAAKGFKGADGKDIVIGIRPEHILLEPSKGFVKVPCELILVEPLGSEALVHTEVNNVPFIIKAETYGDIAHLNDTTCFYVKAADVRAFDKATGEIISDQKLAVHA